MILFEMVSGPLHKRGDDGFTLVEMVISVALVGFVFFALSSAMAAGLKSVALQKGRTQGNEVATQGIEDLQRYAFSTLQVCGAASPTRAGLELTVTSTSSGCTSSATKATYGDHPCQAGSPTSTGVAAAEYTCSRINRTYTVKRYVAWTDSGQRAKRMAVYVSWTDQLGTHEVSQQSSLRSPATGDILGIDPPFFVSGSVSASPPMSDVTFAADGAQNPNGIAFSAQVRGITDLTKDRVYVSYLVMGADGSVTSQTTSLSGTMLDLSQKLTGWTGGATAVFPIGSQYVTFHAVREIDGKTGSALSDTVSFCPGSDCSTVSPPLPDFVVNGSGVVAQSSDPLTLKIDSAGQLLEPFTLTATTKQLTDVDRVSVQLLTRSGAVSFGLNPINTVDSPCTIDGCLWTATVEPASGYGFREGDLEAYFTASQLASTSTAAAKSSPLKAVVQP